MTVPVRLSINGRTYQRDVEPRTLLVHFIRELAGLTGTKVGCAIGAEKTTGEMGSRPIRGAGQ